MTPTEIMTRFQPLMPEGVSFRAAIPLPYQDEEGTWHAVADDAVVIRVQTDSHVVDAMVREADFSWTDEMFRERVLQPMFAMLERALS